jgi:cell shape-determining protein MreD
MLLNPLSLFFVLLTLLCAADWGAAMGVCLAGGLLWDALELRRAQPPLARECAMFALV